MMKATLRPLRSLLSSLPPRPLPPTSQLHVRPSQASAPQQRCASRWVRTTPYQRFRDGFRDSWDSAKRDYPIVLPIGFICAIGSISLVALLLYDDYKNVKPQFAGYPLPVERQLRLALHNTISIPDPAAATKYFAQAIKEAEDCGMAPFSREFMGIRIRFAQMLEQFGYGQAAVEVMTRICNDYEKKLAEMDGQQTMVAATQDESPPVTREAVLRGIIESKVKISSLYESESVQDTPQAKQVLSDAVGLLVKETRDPQTNGFTEQNAAGMSMEEVASILSQMGDLYATSGEEANAVQVYMLTLQPLRASCNGTRSCKEVQVLSNIASTMTIAMKKPSAKINGKPATKESLAAARRSTLKWSDQAIATADLVPPESRDDICELGLLSAQMTRAELLMDSGEKQKARETFISLLPMLRERGLDTLTEVAEQGLKKASG